LKNRFLDKNNFGPDFPPTIVAGISARSNNASFVLEKIKVDDILSAPGAAKENKSPVARACQGRPAHSPQQNGSSTAPSFFYFIFPYFFQLILLLFYFLSKKFIYI
jgi:hypothetical protein